jgi:P4 family phage/plasmid primase-like protien
METDINQFKKFHELLTHGNSDYEPFYFRLTKNGKDPAVTKSWKESRLSVEDAIKTMSDGYNIGIAATSEDRLVIMDVDDLSEVGEFKETLTCTSRKRIGRHAFYFTEDTLPENIFVDSAKQNIATENAGEIRSNWQYVVAAGSYVPVNEEEFELIPDDDKINAGKYTVINYINPVGIIYDEFPDVYKKCIEVKRQDAIKAEIGKKNRELKRTNVKTDNKSALYELDITDVVGSSHKDNMRFPSLFHGSETGKNTSIKDGLLHCWRHNVSHNAFTAIAVMAGIAECGRAGFDHGSGVSGIDFSDGETVFNVWKYAKEQGYIPDDDPIPTNALCYFAVDNALCVSSDIIDGWKLPPTIYNLTIAKLEDGNINSGREAIKNTKKQDSIEKKTVRQILSELDKIDFPKGAFEKQSTVKKFIIENMIGYDRSDIETFADEYIYPVSKVETKAIFKNVVRDAISIIKKLYKEQNEEEAETGHYYPVDCVNDLLAIKPLFVRRETLNFYVYGNGYYKNMGTRKTILPLRNEIRKIYKSNNSQNLHPDTEFIESVVTMLQDTCYVENIEADILHADKICMLNGVYDLKTDKLLPHSKDYGFIRQIPVKYDPSAKCPEIYKFFKTLIDEGIITEKDKCGLFEWFGYCLIPDNRFKKSAFMIGERNSGKSKIISLFENFIGIDNVSLQSLQRLEENTFSSSMLEGMLANVCADMGSKTIYDSPIFKTIVGGDRQTGEGKGKDAHNFIGTARLMFAANEPPHIHKSREAFFTRILSFLFKREVPMEKRDKNILGKITTPDELSGLFNIVLKSLHELLVRDAFINEMSIKETELVYSMKSEPLNLFAEECLVEGDYTSKDEVYNFYKDIWCPARRVKPEKSISFKRKLHNLIGVEETGREKQPSGIYRPRGYAVYLITEDEFLSLGNRNDDIVLDFQECYNDIQDVPTLKNRDALQDFQGKVDVLTNGKKNISHNTNTNYVKYNITGSVERNICPGNPGAASENVNLDQPGYDENNTDYVEYDEELTDFQPNPMIKDTIEDIKFYINGKKERKELLIAKKYRELSWDFCKSYNYMPYSDPAKIQEIIRKLAVNGSLWQ